MTPSKFSSFLIYSVTALAIAGSAGAAFSQEADAPVSSEQLLSSETTVIDQPLAYPTDGQAEVTASIVTLLPGAETGWHVHPGPMFGYMLEGELTVDYGDEGSRVYRTGDSLMEAMNWPHLGVNTGDVSARVLTVYMGVEGLPVSIAVDAPGN